MKRAINLLAIAQAAVKFARAAADVVQHKEQLTDAYFAWRVAAGVHGLIERDDANWNAMLVATDDEFRALQNAKGRKRRAEKKLVALAGDAEVQ